MKIEFGTGARFARLNKKDAKELIDFAIESGIKSFDCGVNYGNWKSQPLLGNILKKYLRKNRSDFEISSKINQFNGTKLRIFTTSSGFSNDASSSSS